MDDETARKLDSLQRQINNLAVITGQLLAALAAADSGQRDLLDHGMAVLGGAFEGLPAGEHVIGRLRSGMDAILSAARRGDDEPLEPGPPRG